MPTPPDIRKKVREGLDGTDFSAVTTDALRNLLHYALLLPSNELDALTPEICTKLAAVDDPKTAVIAVLSAPRPPWVRAVLDRHGLKAFSKLYITDNWQVAFHTLLDPRHITNAELRMIFTWLSPVVQSRAGIVAFAASEARRASDGERLMSVLQGAEIKAAELFEAMHLLRPWHPEISHVLEVGTEAFDAIHHPTRRGIAQHQTAWKNSDGGHLFAAALARQDVLPADFEPLGTGEASDDWARSLGRIAKSRHHQVKLAASLRGLGGTRGIFSIPRKDLISFFEDHAP